MANGPNIQTAVGGLSVAITMETRGQSLYARAQRLLSDESLVSLLRELEAEEREHERLFTRLLSEAGSSALSSEQQMIAAAQAAAFFFPGGLMQAAMGGAFDSREAFLEEAIREERASIAFYERLLAQLEHTGQADEGAVAAIRRIVAEEQRHVRALMDRKARDGGVLMITRTPMGKIAGGQEVDLYTFKNTSGAMAQISTLGGCILSIQVPDKDGNISDVTIGYDTLETMQAGGGYMGYLIGRFGNRIGGASFMLSGKEYTLAKNNGENHLHGGINGFDKKVWEARVEGDALVLTTISPDGEEGYPGTLSVQVVYRFSEDNVLSIEYETSTDADTIVNLTNHVYFNLSGPSSPSVSGHFIQINADMFTEVKDSASIPTGRLLPVENTPFDLRRLRNIGEGLAQEQTDEQMRFGMGYDHNFVIRGFDGTLKQAAIVVDPASGRRLETWTDQPGIQFYGGNMISGETKGKCGVPYVARQGFCLETQHYPDSIHHENFPSCVLRKGETLKTRTEYRFSVE